MSACEIVNSFPANVATIFDRRSIVKFRSFDSQTVFHSKQFIRITFVSANISFRILIKEKTTRNCFHHFFIACSVHINLYGSSSLVRDTKTKFNCNHGSNNKKKPATITGYCHAAKCTHRCPTAPTYTHAHNFYFFFSFFFVCYFRLYSSFYYSQSKSIVILSASSILPRFSFLFNFHTQQQNTQ